MAGFAQTDYVPERRDQHLTELYEPCTFAELSWYEALGFCGLGEGGKLVESGATAMGGELPLNPSGGVISTNCIGATAMIRVAEAAVQIMGKGGGAPGRGREHGVGHRLRRKLVDGDYDSGRRMKV